MNTLLDNHNIWKMPTLLVISLSALTWGCSTSSSAARQADLSTRYAQALEDPENLLVPPSAPLIPAHATPGGTLKRTIPSMPTRLNWLTTNDASFSEIQIYAHNTFARQDLQDPDAYVPELAYKVTANKDRTEYTIYLREGVYWHVPQVDLNDPKNDWLREPRELTAEDALFYFEMAQHPQVGADFIRNYVQDIQNLEQLDRYTFRVTWDRPLYHSEFTTLLAYPLPKWLFTRDRNGEEIRPESVPSQLKNHWSTDLHIGTGPYRIRSVDAGSRVLLERNQDYWRELPPIAEIDYQVVADPNQAWSQLLEGQIHFLGNISPDQYQDEILKADPQNPFNNGALQYDLIDRFAYYYIGWNMNGELFDDPRVRQAMTYAFDRQRAIDDVLHGLGELQTGPFYYKHPVTNPDIKALPFDLDQAARLLDKAGWSRASDSGIRTKVINGEPREFRFTLTAYNNPAAAEWTKIYRQALLKIGVHMDVDFVDWPTMQERMANKDFDAFTGGWALSWFNDPFQLWHSSQADARGGSNHVGFRNSEADQLIEELRQTLDRDQRLALFHRFHQLIHEEQPYTFFYAPKEVIAWNPLLKNVVFQKFRPQSYSLPWFIDESAN